MTSRLMLGGCVERLRELPDDSVGSVVTDPPYGLGFMGKEWDSPGGLGDHPMRRNHGTNTVNTGVTRQGGRQRTCDDFTRRQLRDARTYQAWCEEWAAECLRVLRPGGFIVAFSSTRTYHRLASAIEEAGFEVRDTIAWLYGSGFPKHKSLLKPAMEPLCVARKTGRGWLNTAACVVPFQSDADEREAKDKNRHAEFDSEKGGNAVYGDYSMVERRDYDAGGRWPANVVLDEDAAAMLDEQTEGRTFRGHFPAARGAGGISTGGHAGQDGLAERAMEVGGASRFFYCAKADTDERQAGLVTPSLFTPTDAPARNDHPTVKPVDLMRWLVRLATPEGGTVVDPFLGSGTTAIAAALEGFPFVGIERDPHYMSIAQARIAHWSGETVEAA